MSCQSIDEELADRRKKMVEIAANVLGDPATGRALGQRGCRRTAALAVVARQLNV